MSSNRGETILKIDAAATKLRAASDHIGTLVQQLSEQRDEVMSSWKRRVETAELKLHAMATFLTQVGTFRGQTSEDVLGYFERAVSPFVEEKPAQTQAELPAMAGVAEADDTSPAEGF